MSIIGWEVDYNKLEEKCTVTTPEEFVMETRFDPNTGKKLPKKQKVVTKPSETQLVFDGQKANDIFDIVANMARAVSFDYQWSDSGRLFFGLYIKEEASFSDIIRLKYKLECVKVKLLKLGIPFNRKIQPSFHSSHHPKSKVQC